MLSHVPLNSEVTVKRASSSTLALVFVLAATAMVADQVKAADAADPREKLETAVPEVIRLLEAKEYATMLKEFVSPDALKKITAEVSFDELVQRFSAGKADDLLKTLKSIQGRKPEMSADGSKATFAREDPKARPVVFMKTDKYWYIAN
jgi:hypothetical protein